MFVNMIDDQQRIEEWHAMFKNNEKDIKSKIISIKNYTGVKYATIIGDWNPIHLWSLTAKLTGYKQPIIHGMWSLQRCINEMEDNLYKNDSNFVKNVINNDIMYTKCVFKMPCYVPSEALLRVFETKKIDDNSASNNQMDYEYHFGMSSVDTNNAYVIGVVSGFKDDQPLKSTLI